MARWLVAHAVVTLAVARAAAADPAIVLDRCAAFDRDALRAAIQRELVASAVHHDVTLVIACPDAVTAHLSIEPAQGLARTLDLGEVPGDLRMKLLAVAALELVLVADPSPPATHEPARPLVAPPPVEPAVASAERIARVPDDTMPRPAPFAIAVHSGVRFHAEPFIPLVHVAAEVELGRFAAGAAASGGTSVEDPLGTLKPYLLTATGSMRLACWGIVQLACARVRGELGVAAVTATSYTPMVAATDAASLYAQLGLALDVEHSFGAWGLVFAVDAAWSEGLVATVQDRQPVRLDGLAVTTLLGLRWHP